MNMIISLQPKGKKFVFRRAQYWNDPENDPRWNKDNFQFSPKLARRESNSYQRLGAEMRLETYQIIAI